MSHTNAYSRYPGIRSFQQDESKIFFGRNKETEELSSLIKVERFVVLFAKSGIGKTSLLNAGVLPVLEKEDYHPIHIRFQNTKLNPAQLLLGKVKEEIAKSGISEMVDNRLKDWCGERSATLWEHLKACSMVMSYLPAKPLLILDQFEEFFTHEADVREAFVELLADIIFSRIPLAVQQLLQQKEYYNEQWASPLNWKLVFSIRSDRLSMLDNLSKVIPAILNNRYQLNPLNTKNATAAILDPAQSTAYKFVSTTFTYAPQALKDITNNLSNTKGEIESFQLQLICHNLEEKVIAEQLKEIKPKHIGGAEGIKKMLNNYYLDKISEIGNEEEQILAKKLIEEGLITNGTRDSVTDTAITATFNISDSLLEKLLATRIIKPESTHLGEGKAYEISHDTLVEPILHSLRIRQAEEERQAQELRLAQQQKEIEAEQKKLKQARQRSLIAIVLASFAILAAIWAYIQTQNAQAAQAELNDKVKELIDITNEAQNNFEQAEQNLKEFQLEKIERLNSSANLLRGAGQPTAEKQALQAIQKLSNKALKNLTLTQQEESTIKNYQQKAINRLQELDS